MDNYQEQCFLCENSIQTWNKVLVEKDTLFSQSIYDLFHIYVRNFEVNKL